ncbi:hypothetical protein B296_00031260 [Ensete ventricosum]|uniref:RRM domain-containing protein n=1 Tax=Ensete ventricosum TaxID=4639 RepID=A0A427A260_ENSVE|nr:hypothetical protein B296_00031260 [Ensete ventricosum]
MAEPSKVIHIRNVGQEISEVAFSSCILQNDLLQLVQPFGVVTKLVMLRAKNQVFFFPLFSLVASLCAPYAALPLFILFLYDRLFFRCMICLPPLTFCSTTQMSNQV